MSVAKPMDMADPAAKPYAYERYARMRQETPIYHTRLPGGEPLWFVTRYADVVAMFKDERLVKDYRNLLTAAEQSAQTGNADLEFINRTMLFRDPPDHARLRSLVANGFTPSRIEALRPRIQQIADQLLDALEPATPFDLINAYAFPLPIMVISELLGVPHADQDQFRAWSALVVGGSTMVPDSPQRIAALRAFGGYIQQLIARRRADPVDDLVSLLVHAEEQGARLSESELIAMIFLLIVAGHETTVNLIANSALALLTHPAQLALLRAKPELIKSAVEECLRFDGPVETATMRFAREDLLWDGQQIRRGDRVLLVINSADRDPASFERPDELDITRQIKHHVAFGHGIHYCLGAPLARLEGQIAIQTLLGRFAHLRLAVDPATLVYRQSLLIRGLEQMPVVDGPAAGESAP